MASAVVKVNVISDTVCPWCLVGKKNLEKAAALLASRSPPLRLDVVYHPFLLVQPEAWKAFGESAVTTGVDKKAFYDQRFGKDKWKSFMPRLQQAMSEAGVVGFNMDGKTGPTADSHRLLARAYELHGGEKQSQLKEELMRSYFLEGKALCDASVLREAAGRAGLAEMAEEVLSSPVNEKAFAEELKYGRSLGVTGVPHFVIEGARETVSLGGAQPPDVLAASILAAAGLQ